jgi:hypothetical protein
MSLIRVGSTSLFVNVVFPPTTAAQQPFQPTRSMVLPSPSVSTVAPVVAVVDVVVRSRHVVPPVGKRRSRTAAVCGAISFGFGGGGDKVIGRSERMGLSDILMLVSILRRRKRTHRLAPVAQGTRSDGFGRAIVGYPRRRGDKLEPFDDF